jgi:hypothetical protein
MLSKLNNSHDDALTNVVGLNWLPWIGCRYPETDGMLLLGESFYEDGQGWLSKKDATRHLVHNQGLHSHQPQFSKSRFFRNVERTILNQPQTSFTDRELLWTSVAYFNLVQRPMSSIKERPTARDLDLGWHVFLEVAKIIKPQICVRLGITGIGRLGRLLATKTTGWQYESTEFSKRPLIIKLRHEDYSLQLVCINHPSGNRGYNYREWSKIVQNIMKVEEFG